MVLAALVRRGFHVLVPFGEGQPYDLAVHLGEGAFADIFGVYFPPDGSVYLVPIQAVARFEGRLRLTPTRNNQRRRVREAADFEIDRWSAESLREVVRGEPNREELALSVA